MSRTIEMIVEEVETSIDEIQRELSSKGFNYTGFASSSLRIVAATENVQLVGADYIEFLAEGRGRGKTRSSGDGTATKRIFEWVQKKLAPLLGISDQESI